jgi:hypothetical protein
LKKNGVKIKQNQVIHYSRRDPVSKKLNKEIKYMRSDIPCDDEFDVINWTEIRIKTKTNDELFDEINSIPQLLNTTENEKNLDLVSPFPTLRHDSLFDFD